MAMELWNTGARDSKTVVGRTLMPFDRNWTGRGILKNGTEVLADFKIHEPSGGRGYFHMVLDASGSMFANCADGGSKVVYEQLFACFEDLMKSGEAVRPGDIICVWSFNKTTKLLCEVETKFFHTKKDFIRKEYEKELNNKPGNCETCLHDAVGTVMDKIRETCETYKKAEFFLAVFTDGIDSGTGSTSLGEMIQKIMKLVGRLHTFFITLNLSTDSDLYKTLDCQTELSLIKCESTKPRDISQAFNTLRGLIIAVLVLVTKEAGANSLPSVQRLAQRGATKAAIGDSMMATLATEMRNTSLFEAYGNLNISFSK